MKCVPGSSCDAQNMINSTRMFPTIVISHHSWITPDIVISLRQVFMMILLEELLSLLLSGEIYCLTNALSSIISIMSELFLMGKGAVSIHPVSSSTVRHLADMNIIWWNISDSKILQFMLMRWRILYEKLVESWKAFCLFCQKLSKFPSLRWTVSRQCSHGNWK